MKTVGERLKYYIENKEVNVRQFCIKNKIAYNSFHQILNGTRNMGLNTLKQVIDVYPQLNLNWVIKGIGSVEISTTGNNISEPESIYGKMDPGLEMVIKYLDSDVAQDKLNELIELKLKDHGKEK